MTSQSDLKQLAQKLGVSHIMDSFADDTPYSREDIVGMLVSGQAGNQYRLADYLKIYLDRVGGLPSVSEARAVAIILRQKRLGQPNGNLGWHQVLLDYVRYARNLNTADSDIPPIEPDNIYPGYTWAQVLATSHPEGPNVVLATQESQSQGQPQPQREALDIDNDTSMRSDTTQLEGSTLYYRDFSKPWKRNPHHGAYTNAPRPKYPKVFRPYGHNTRETVVGFRKHTRMNHLGYDAEIVESRAVAPLISPSATLGQSGAPSITSRIPALRPGSHHCLFAAGR